jgi:hypothetical protein
MKIRSALISVAFAALFMIISCDKVDESGNNVSDTLGSVAGFVTIYDEYGNKMYDRGGVKVSVDNGTDVANTTTNSDGRFQIDEIPAGTYMVTFSKSGYSTYKIVSLPVVGGTIPYFLTVAISQKSTTFPSNFSLLPGTSANTVSVSCNISPEVPSGSYRTIRFFIGKTASVSSTNYLATTASISSLSSYTSVKSLDKILFPSGSTVYMIVYGDTYNSISYPDTETGLYIYSGLSSPGSNVASVIVP